MSENYYRNKLERVLGIYGLEGTLAGQYSHSPEKFYLPDLGCSITVMAPPTDSHVRTLCYVERQERHEGEERCPYFEALLFGDHLEGDLD